VGRLSPLLTAFAPPLFLFFFFPVLFPSMTEIKKFISKSLWFRFGRINYSGLQTSAIFAKPLQRVPHLFFAPT
jgi:hypothetical protein